MILTPEKLDSSVIKKLYWVQNSEILLVTFHSNSIWVYKNITQQDYENMIAADSLGSYFNNFIRNSKPSILLYKKEN
jgi:hypothetical protein